MEKPTPNKMDLYTEKKVSLIQRNCFLGVSFLKIILRHLFQLLDTL